MIRCILSGLAGVAILAAYAFATITHTGADEASQALIWASTGGLVIGAIMVARTKSLARLLIIPFVICGEGYASWQTFERVLDTREAQASIGLSQQAALDAGEARLAKAVSDVQAAQQAVKDSAPLRDCKANCRALLQDAVDAALGELSSARSDLSELPIPQVANVSAAKTGIDAWKITLALAVALALSTNGLGAALVGVAAHDWPAPVVSVSTIADRVELDFQPLPKVVVSEDRLPPPIPPEPPKRKRFPDSQVVDFQKHKVLRVLASEATAVSNTRLAQLLGETEGEASKSWREVSEHLEIGRQGKELRIALKRTA